MDILLLNIQMGHFIVLEGLDGAGKSTQIELLLQHLQAKEGRVQFVHFPRTSEGGVFGDLIARFLRGEFGAADQVHPQLVALLFAEDRKAFAPNIREWLHEGYTVVADRYVLSNIAFQCAKLAEKSEKETLTNWIIDFEFNYNQLPAPDISLYLDVPFDFVAGSLTKAREGESRAYLQGKKDIHESDLSFQQAVKNEYDRLCAGDFNLRKIDCSDATGAMIGAEQVHAAIAAAVDDVTGR
ncbi:MAG: dTMP kinase [Saprospiraceae bacterium]|nr:dTMP kinase [Saprospiraceae bacterium]